MSPKEILPNIISVINIFKNIFKLNSDDVEHEYSYTYL